MTLDDLRKICPFNAGRAVAFVQPLSAAMQEFGLTTGRRQAAFIAQVAHETMEFRCMRELASGSDYEPGTERGKELGNTQPGDGPRFKGGGGLMITGRDVYTRSGQALRVDLVNQPTLVEVPTYAMRTAAWFWQTRKLSDFADADHFGALTHAINGGYNGIDPRIVYWLAARRVLQVQ